MFWYGRQRNIKEPMLPECRHRRKKASCRGGTAMIFMNLKKCFEEWVIKNSPRFLFKVCVIASEQHWGFVCLRRWHFVAPCTAFQMQGVHMHLLNNVHGQYEHTRWGLGTLKQHCCEITSSSEQEKKNCSPLPRDYKQTSQRLHTNKHNVSVKWVPEFCFAYRMSGSHFFAFVEARRRM